MKNFIAKNSTSFIFLVILYLVLQFLSTLPYANLFINDKSIFGIVWIVCIVLFHLKPSASVILGIICLVFTFIFQQLGLSDQMYSFANAMYLLLILSVVHEVIVISKK